MAKQTRNKKGSKENPLSTEDLESIIGDEYPFIIIEANIKDDFCNYRFQVTKGIGIGDRLSCDGQGIIKDSMRDAFARFNVHLACIDDAFKYSEIEIEDIDVMHTHELTGNFHVTGYTITGGKDNESIILKGNKYVRSAGGRIELKSPKIPLDNLSSYHWWNELKTEADNARHEVALYKNGNYTPVEVEEDKPNPKQTRISFEVIIPPKPDEQSGEKQDGTDDFSDFEKGAI